MAFDELIDLSPTGCNGQLTLDLCVRLCVSYAFNSMPICLRRRKVQAVAAAAARVAGAFESVLLCSKYWCHCRVNEVLCEGQLVLAVN